MEIIKNKNLTIVLKKISYYQIFLLCFVALVLYFYKLYNITNGFVIAGIFSFIYTQSLQFSAQSKVFMVLGFPLRLLFIALPAALLVHKFHANLLALFIGFVLSQVIYFVFIWSYAKNIRTCH